MQHHPAALPAFIVGLATVLFCAMGLCAYKYKRQKELSNNNSNSSNVLPLHIGIINRCDNTPGSATNGAINASTEYSSGPGSGSSYISSNDGLW